MTIASEITRLQWAKATARTSIENKWVTVPVSASVEDYHTYIDQIQQWVPTADYNTVVSVGKWASIWYPHVNYTEKTFCFWWSSFLCKIGNYLFMIGGFGERYAWGTWSYEYFDSYVWIYYKQEWASSWSWVQKFLWNSSSGTSTSATLRITPVYVQADNKINMKVEVVANRWDIPWTYYIDWVVGSSTISNSSQLTWEDLNNYKIYSSSISIWTIDPNSIDAVWYKIDEPLL